MIKKWVTWVIETDDLRKLNQEESHELEQMIRSEIDDLLIDILEGQPISFKITNLPRDRK